MIRYVIQAKYIVLYQNWCYHLGLFNLNIMSLHTVIIIQVDVLHCMFYRGKIEYVISNLSSLLPIVKYFL